jgi:hypothetical protein
LGLDDERGGAEREHDRRDERENGCYGHDEPRRSQHLGTTRGEKRASHQEHERREQDHEGRSGRR